MEKKYVLKVAADGRVEREPFDAEDSLGQLQRAVGGYIERVPLELQRGIDLFVNEEGLLNGLPLNRVLTEFATQDSGWIELRGDGVFAAHDGEGETVGLTEAECAELEASLARCGAVVEEGKEA